MRILLTIITLGFSVNLFSQTFQQAIYKHANEIYAGQGISNRHNADFTLHSYGTVLMETYYNAYISTGDLHFLDQLAIQCFRIQTHRDDRIRNYTDFDTDPYYYNGCDPVNTGFLPYDPNGNPTNSPTWSALYNCSWTRFTLHSMSITYPMALLAKLILIDDPTLQSKQLPAELITTISAEGNSFSLQNYGDLALFLRSCVRETIDWHLANTLITEVSLGYSGFTDMDGGNSGQLLAVNMQAASGKTIAVAYLIENYLGNTAKANIYQNKLSDLANIIHGELYENSGDNYSYAWKHNYGDCVNGFGDQSLEDVEHGQIIMDFADICFENEIYGYQQSTILFTEEDMKKFASTFKKYIYIDPDNYAANVYGASEFYNCQQLSGLAINTAYSYIKMAKYDRDIYGIISDLYAASALNDVTVPNENFHAFASLNYLEYLFNPRETIEEFPSGLLADELFYDDFKGNSDKNILLFNASNNVVYFHDLDDLLNFEGKALGQPTTGRMCVSDFLNNTGKEIVTTYLNEIDFYNYSSSQPSLPVVASYSNPGFETVVALSGGDLIPQMGNEEVAYVDYSGRFKIISSVNNNIQEIMDIASPFTLINEKIFIGDADRTQNGDELIVFDNSTALNIYNVVGNNLILSHSLAVDNFFCSDLSIGDFDNDGLNEIVAVNANDGDFYIYKIVDGVLKESGREYFPVNFQNGLITTIHRSGETYPNQLLSIRKFDGKATVYDMAGKCSYLELSDLDITTETSIDNSYTGAQNDYSIDYHSPNIITASNMVVEPDVTGEFVSGTAIRMKDGFRATAGSQFTARIDEVNLSCDEPFFRKPTQNISSTEPESLIIPKGKLLVFPNPTSSTFSFELPVGTNMDNIQINLYDNTGRLVFSRNEYLKTVNLSHFTVGIYFLEIKSDEGVFREKIVKN